MFKEETEVIMAEQIAISPSQKWLGFFISTILIEVRK
jgi:hypothetical protein